MLDTIAVALGLPSDARFRDVCTEIAKLRAVLETAEAQETTALRFAKQVRAELATSQRERLKLRAALATAHKEQSSLIARAVGEAMRAHDEEIDRLGSERDEARAALETARLHELTPCDEIRLAQIPEFQTEIARLRAELIAAERKRDSLAEEISDALDHVACLEGAPSCAERWPGKGGYWCHVCLTNEITRLRAELETATRPQPAHRWGHEWYIVAALAAAIPPGDLADLRSYLEGD